MDAKDIARNRSELKEAIRESRIVKIMLLRAEYDRDPQTEGYETLEFRPLDYDEESDCFYGLLKVSDPVEGNGPASFIPASVHSEGICGVLFNH
ncbi:hypothetical protein LZD49_20585 [Dyadobacter sp. CY261]|uniref:hypothetical protein n=1 Tax=Dyadobacter sp. CY261 TaxID=2907203 RepID=UPI001F38B1D8|nr:hypothetical protein [Dyadobacter sp. CY261]MCF0072888.1 hypothetical protein [Dyadobacter sp. CY261]